MKYISWEEEYDIIVLGGGVAGVAAALAASREKKSVLLIEKSLSLGGLATYGLINLFEPMCNGRGIQIISGMAEELLNLAIADGYDTLPTEWKNKKPDEYTEKRYATRFSAPIFTLALTKQVVQEGIELLLDCLGVAPIMEGKVCKGVATESKSGRLNFKGKVIVDTTGDGDLFFRAGVPMTEQGNYFTYISRLIDFDTLKKALEEEDIGKATRQFYGGQANLYGKNQPENQPLYRGTQVKDISQYVIENHLILLEKLRESDPKSRDVVTLPGMPQFRTTRCLIGGHVFSEKDCYQHFEDSIGTICDFSRRDYIFEVPYRTLVHQDFPNLITAGRSASAKGFGWDILRVIPPAILTGQAAGIAASIAATKNTALSNIPISQLQKKLEESGVRIHFDDQWIPKKGDNIGEAADDEEHL